MNKTLKAKIKQLEGQEDNLIREEGFFQFENLYMEYLILEEEKLEKEKRELMRKILSKTEGKKNELRIIEEGKAKQNILKRIGTIFGSLKRRGGEN